MINFLDVLLEKKDPHHRVFIALGNTWIAGFQNYTPIIEKQIKSVARRNGVSRDRLAYVLGGSVAAVKRLNLSDDFEMLVHIWKKWTFSRSLWGNAPEHDTLSPQEIKALRELDKWAGTTLQDMGLKSLVTLTKAKIPEMKRILDANPYNEVWSEKEVHEYLVLSMRKFGTIRYQWFTEMELIRKAVVAWSH